MSRYLAWVLTAFLTGCGAGQNFNKIWGDDEAADSLLLEAKGAFDTGNFARAQRLAERVYLRYPANEEAAILLGYIYLSQGGVDSFQLARQLTNTEDDSDSDEFDESSNLTLSKLSSLLDVSDEEFARLAKAAIEPKTDSFKSNGKSLKILIPADVTDELRQSVHVLERMNAAIKVICPLVSESVKVETNPGQRHVCASSSRGQAYQAKAHFLWAFSHLAEVLVYQSVLLYSSGPNKETSTSNFQAAANNINNFQTNDIDVFVQNVQEMKTMVDQVFTISSQNSMITATLNDLSAIDKAFSALSGLPASITKSIRKVMTQIESVSKQLGDSSYSGRRSAARANPTA